MQAISSDGKFLRGWDPDHKGQFVYCVERDRVLALRLVARALELAQKETDRAGQAELHLAFARILLMEKARGEIAGGWKFQLLTNLGELPDYEKDSDDSDCPAARRPGRSRRSTRVLSSARDIRSRA